MTGTPHPRPGNPAPTPRKSPSLMRSLGLFVGHVARGLTTKVQRTPEPPQRVEVSRTVEEAHGESPAGPVTLRRTVIEEIVLPASPASPPSAPDSGNRDPSARE